MVFSDLSPEEIERRYLESPYVKEICVLRLSDDASTTDRLFAVVVPDLELMRRRRIVNIGDLLRFELEGLSIHLPSNSQVRGFNVWFEPLPRAPSGALERGVIELRLRERHLDAHTTDEASAEWAAGKHATDVVNVIRRRAGGRAVRANSNLEIDLGFDSMARVELIAELEQRLGVRLPQERAHLVLTVAELIEGLEPGSAAIEPSDADQPWAVLLRDLPAASDRDLSPLFEKHLLKAVFYLFLRMMRLVIPAIRVTGLEHLPRDGPYIISPNHQSYLDPFFICSVLPYRIVRDIFAVGAAEYIETPAVIWFARQMNLIPVDPDANLVPAMKAAAFGLERGKILILFPEGERSIDGSVKRFKKGAPILSRHVGVSIVPVAIRGIFQVWPRNRPFNWRVLLPWSGHRIHISFGPQLRIDEGITDAVAAEALQQRVAQLWDSPEQRSDGQHAGDARDKENA